MYNVLKAVKGPKFFFANELKRKYIGHDPVDCEERRCIKLVVGRLTPASLDVKHNAGSCIK